MLEFILIQILTNAPKMVSRDDNIGNRFNKISTGDNADTGNNGDFLKTLNIMEIMETFKLMVQTKNEFLRIPPMDMLVLVRMDHLMN